MWDAERLPIGAASITAGRMDETDWVMAVCKTVPCDCRMAKIPDQSASANEFANETSRDGGDDVRHRRRSQRPSPGQRDARDARDVRRGAHNPEVVGSNPTPATKARGPFSNRGGAFCLWFVHDRALGADLLKQG